MISETSLAALRLFVFAFKWGRRVLITFILASHLEILIFVGFYVRLRYIS